MLKHLKNVLVLYFTCNHGLRRGGCLWPYIYTIKGDRSVCLFRMAGQTAGPIETKLDTRTHVHPGSVSGKANVKVIHVCLREWQNYETPGMRHLANDAHTTSARRRTTTAATPSERNYSNEASRGEPPQAASSERRSREQNSVRRTGNYS